MSDYFVEAIGYSEFRIRSAEMPLFGNRASYYGVLTYLKCDHLRAHLTRAIITVTRSSSVLLQAWLRGMEKLEFLELALQDAGYRLVGMVILRCNRRR